ncbi:glycoside hydrolase family 28 protein [Xylariaceae sp. FL0255]|nr:glycoside hydrolase family 28 protein [Xylariaceae sp. FL0255]
MFRVVGRSLIGVGLVHLVLVTLSGAETPSEPRWLIGEPDPYVCEYLGENNCWQPSIIEEGPPYLGFDGPRPPRTKECVVKASGDPNGDDAPAVLQAFSECSQNAHIIFENTTYYIASVMNTTGLQNVDVEIKGTLEWNNTDFNYWLVNSLPVGFQNQSSAWFFGGADVHFYGHGYGTLNGNGQDWYSYNNGTSNLAGRPHAITISNSKDCVIEGLRFIKSQMWTMTVARSERMLLQDIYVNNTCAPGAGTFSGCNVNTDGCDTVYANNITFLRWTVDNGDDAIALKQNSTNIYVADSKFYNGEGIAFGSIGQYPDQIEIMENFTARNVYASNTAFGCRLKTWTGETEGYPPNGGGGGLGHAKNLTCTDFTLDNVDWAWSVNQKTSYNGDAGSDNTSLFQVEDLYFSNSQGTVSEPYVGTFQCSAAAPCPGIHILNNSLTVTSNGTAAKGFRCTNVVDPVGFNCTADCGSEDSLCPS